MTTFVDLLVNPRGRYFLTCCNEMEESQKSAANMYR